MPSMPSSLTATPYAIALPGVVLSFTLAGGALAVHAMPGMGAFSPAILAILLGIIVRRPISVVPAYLKPGLTLSVRTLLRLGVVLLGLQVTLAQVSALGVPVLVAVSGGLLVCFFGTSWIGARLGVPRPLARLIGIGTAVCGASAVVAGNSVIEGDDEDVAYALAAVTVFGTASMMILPALALAAGLDPQAAGLWMGSSIHEVAQVVGAATQVGGDAVGIATVTKMFRVLLLAPLVLFLAAMECRRSERTERAKVPVPWFVFGFLALSAVSSLGVVPPFVIKDCGTVAAFLLAAALGAMGFGIELRSLRQKGIRPFLLALIASVLIAGTSFSLLRLLA